MKVQYIIRLKRGDIIFKSFYLPKSYNLEKGQGAIDDLNNLLNEAGVFFDVSKNNIGQRLIIKIDEEKFKKVTTCKSGRPIEHEIDFGKVQQLKADGKTNKEIYTELGISKSLFYLKMKEYKNNIGHE